MPYRPVFLCLIVCPKEHLAQSVGFSQLLTLALLVAVTWPFIEGIFLTPLDSPIGGLMFVPFAKLRGPVGIFLAGDAGAEGDHCDNVDAGLA